MSKVHCQAERNDGQEVDVQPQGESEKDPDEQIMSERRVYQNPVSERKEARKLVEEANSVARAILRRVTERAICRRMFVTDGEMSDLRAGWYRLRSLGCQGRGLDYLVDRRGCEIVNAIRKTLCEAHGEGYVVEAVPRPKGTEWLEEALKGSGIDERLMAMAAARKPVKAKARCARGPSTADLRGGDA